MTSSDTPSQAQNPRFRAIRYATPEAALAQSVMLTLKAPAFANLRFGHWARILVGQVNRGQYLILLENDRPVGFGGWFLARERDAEAWLTEDRDIPVAPPEEADCAIVNAFLAPSREATQALRDAMLAEGRPYGTIYGKRVLADGRKRLVRLANSRRAR
ncbi:hypothetical protein [Thalassococcus sp. S3]|uniref:hypothetical protein n=1 Tax=Thalassococcus sp. S3 TaxID=2017482 RepID=UPI0010245B94|nr:hypothetical protein [Thalassococcus sp. S3]QBF34256.1 hypothetical protein CFI11_24020 [Thalassococcus sp. S3]